jgi:hypothetical protein
VELHEVLEPAGVIGLEMIEHNVADISEIQEFMERPWGRGQIPSKRISSPILAERR